MKKVSPNSNDLLSTLVDLHGNDWIEKQRVAGKCISDIMAILEGLIKDKTSLSLLDIDKLVSAEILKRDCTQTFLNYKGFPASICISVNHQLVHGIPTDYKLQEGDIITFDFGATYEEAIADSAMTLIYGEPKSKDHTRLIETTKECLYNAIKAISIGKQIGVIGNAIFKTAKNKGFNVIEKFGGHGLTWTQVHASPFIANRASPNEGVRIQPGMTLAIEPLLVPGNCSTNTKISEDNWTILAEDICSHEEHTIFIHQDHIEIMTHRQNENIDRNIAI